MTKSFESQSDHRALFQHFRKNSTKQKLCHDSKISRIPVFTYIQYWYVHFNVNYVPAPVWISILMRMLCLFFFRCHDNAMREGKKREKEHIKIDFLRFPKFFTSRRIYSVDNQKFCAPNVEYIQYRDENT